MRTASEGDAPSSESPATQPQDGKLPGQIILFTAGNAMLAQGAATYAAALYSGKDIGLYAWNYPGYGGTDGQVSLRTTLDCALEVYDHVTQRAAKRPIFLHGVSIGGCIAMHVAAERPAAGVIVEAPPRVHHIILSPRFSLWNLWLLTPWAALQVPEEYDPVKTAGRTRADRLLVIAGDADSLIPFNQCVAIHDAWPNERKRLVRLPGCDHCPAPIRSFPGEYRSEVTDFLGRSRPE
jgi:pimeloyl-ACP methyl ester carboxylesterase